MVRISYPRLSLELGCALTGGLAAVLLYSALGTRLATPPAPDMRVRVAVRAAEAPPAVVAPPPREVLLLPTTVTSPEKSTPKVTQDSAPLSAPVEQLPTLEQPTVTAPSAAEAPKTGLPSIGAKSTAEPDPFASKIFVDKPGGDIVVLGLLVDDTGAVLETRMLVPSRFVLADVGLVFASRQLRITGLEPPLQPGEKRWVEQRIDQKVANQRTDVLP